MPRIAAGGVESGSADQQRRQLDQPAAADHRVDPAGREGDQDQQRERRSGAEVEPATS